MLKSNLIIDQFLLHCAYDERNMGRPLFIVSGIIKFLNAPLYVSTPSVVIVVQ